MFSSVTTEQAKRATRSKLEFSRFIRDLSTEFFEQRRPRMAVSHVTLFLRSRLQSAVRV